MVDRRVELGCSFVYSLFIAVGVFKRRWKWWLLVSLSDRSSWYYDEWRGRGDIVVVGEGEGCWFPME